MGKKSSYHIATFARSVGYLTDRGCETIAGRAGGCFGCSRRTKRMWRGNDVGSGEGCKSEERVKERKAMLGYYDDGVGCYDGAVGCERRLTVEVETEMKMGRESG